jgi:hypothetical protein
MRAVRINKNKTGLHEYVVIRFVDEPRIVATQKSVNRRLKPSEKYGIPFASSALGTFWTIESDQEILERVKAEYWDVDDIRIE